MKKIFIIAVIITAIFIFNNKRKDDYVRGIFISYLEYSEHDLDDLDILFNNLEKYHINTIYLQVRMFADSIYNSKIFPYTKYLDGRDYLKLIIDYAHSKNIKVHAWINPYRISSGTDINNIKDSPFYIYINTEHVKVVKDKGIYFNPASNIARNIIIAGVYEIISNYDVDGILYDDYFYPSTDIDLGLYDNSVSLDEYRFNNINLLIKETYSTIKKYNNKILFGVSPDGNISNNYKYHYADIKRWLSEDNYIDYIMPQLYYGFNNSSMPFNDVLEEWNNLIKNDTKLIIALALYKCGNIDNYAKSGKYEWQNNTDIITSQIKVSSKMSNYYGFSLFRYHYIIVNNNDILSKERENYLKN